MRNKDYIANSFREINSMFIELALGLEMGWRDYCAAGEMPIRKLIDTYVKAIRAKRRADLMPMVRIVKFGFDDPRAARFEARDAEKMQEAFNHV